MRITVFGHSENFKKLLDNKVITSYNIVTDKEKSLKPNNYIWKVVFSMSLIIVILKIAFVTTLLRWIFQNKSK